MTDTDDRWKRDWIAFTEFLQQQIENGASEKDLNDCFGGCEVRWKGTIKRISFDESLSSVRVSMPERVIIFSNGSQVQLDGLHLSVAEESMDRWQNLAVGDEVSFTGFLGQAGSPFPSVGLTTFKDGTSLIMIRLSNALPV